MTRVITTVFGLGLLPFAPGTWGALGALPLAWGLHMLGGAWLLIAATLLTSLLGWWATRIETARPGRDPDPSEIVIDELVGQWIALWPVSIGAMHAGLDPLRLWPGILAAFVLFRAFDILKPGPVGWADRLHSPLGVMLDDILAGVLAALGVGLLAWLAHGVFAL
jgi:phosphatidylglycerophosphatase A